MRQILYYSERCPIKLSSAHSNGEPALPCRRFMACACSVCSWCFLCLPWVWPICPVDRTPQPLVWRWASTGSPRRFSRFRSAWPPTVLAVNPSLFLGFWSLLPAVFLQPRPTRSPFLFWVGPCRAPVQSRPRLAPSWPTLPARRSAPVPWPWWVSPLACRSLSRW